MGRCRALALVWTAALLLGSLGASGCAPPNREALIDEVLKADPAFASVLDKHREIANRIEIYEQEFALKRKTVEETIAQLRRDLAAAASTVKGKMLDANQRLAPEREALGLGLARAGEELRAKRSQRASLGRLVAQLRKSLNRQDPGLAPDERERQAAQMDEVLRDASRLDHELAALHEHARLLKLKLLLIRL